MVTALATKNDQAAIAVSFVVTAILGCSYVAHVWLTRLLPVDAALRCATLVMTVLAIHLIGWNELQWQHRLPTMRLAERLRLNARRSRANAPWRLILLSQVVVCLLGSILLDGGDMLQIFTASAAVYWSIVGCSILWRTVRFSKLDLHLVRYGFFVLIPIIAFSWSVVIALKAGRLHFL